jgi:hypothetical protein
MAAPSLEATSVTLVAARKDPRDGRMQTVIPVIEFVSLTAKGMAAPWGVQDLALHFSAWGRTNPLDPGRERGAGEVDLACVQGKALDRALTLSLGRQLVTGGAARALSLDGLHAGFRPFSALGLELYGGAPVIPRFATARGDALAGARATLRHPAGDISASIIGLLDHGTTARKDAGADARLSLLPTVTLAGHAVLSLLESRLSDAEIGAQWHPFPRLELNANARRQAPDLFLPRTSLFTVFAEETRDEVGGDVFIELGHRLTLHVESHFLKTEQGPGLDATARLALRLGSQGSASVQAQRLDAGGSGFSRARIHFVGRTSETILLAFDADGLLLDKPVNGQTRSTTATASMSYALARGFYAVLSATGGATPFFSRRLEIMAKLAFNQAFTRREGAP